MSELTPSAIVEHLDRYIVGQDPAKRAVAIALRNRWRRQQLDPELREEVAPRNIIMIGPTGVGKTEIARRLAGLAEAPFLKVEASKYTEVGYVGKDVESMIRDLTELSVTMVRRAEQESVRDRARHLAEDALLDLLLPPGPRPAVNEAGGRLDALQEGSSTRQVLRVRLQKGELDLREVELELEEKITPTVEVFSSAGLEEMGFNFKEALGQLFPRKTRKRKIKVAEALELLTQREAQRLVDMEHVAREAVRRVENSGIVFLDEIDKIAGRESGHGPEVSRQGVQRDILPIVEGCTVNTKYGKVRTRHILFIAAGAFHVSKPSDLIPELQGRFPIRVELSALSRQDLCRILTEPHCSLSQQYQALLATEGVTVTYQEGALEEVAALAEEVNARTENIGARRLYTMMERLFEELSFNAPQLGGATVPITVEYVRERLQGLVRDRDLSRFVL